MGSRGDGARGMASQNSWLALTRITRMQTHDHPLTRYLPQEEVKRVFAPRPGPAAGHRASLRHTCRQALRQASLSRACGSVSASLGGRRRG